MSDNNTIPGFGWAMRLVRWNETDRTVVGQDGPLPPPRAKTVGRGQNANLVSPEARGQLGLMGGTLQQFTGDPQGRVDVYRIVEAMDQTDIPATILDLYAEDATQVDPETKRTVWIKSKNKAMAQAGNDMLARLRIEEEATALTRDVAKYGDDFERLVYKAAEGGNKEGAGVLRMLPVDPKEMERKQDAQGKLLGYTQQGRKFKGATSDVSHPWDYVHFRLRGNNRRQPYGTSVLRNAIRPWRQGMILEDWMMRYTVSKHPDRNLYLLDGGNAAETDRAEMARRFKQKLKRTMIVDPAGTSGKNFDYNWNPITPDEDMVMVVSRESKTRIEKMHGSANAADVVPLNMVMDRLFGATRTPRGFVMGSVGAEGDNGGLNMKASLTQQSITYARAVQRVQRAVRTGITYLAELNYTLLMGNDPENNEFDWTQAGNEFSVHMANISFLAELERLEVIQLRQQVGVALADMARDNPAYKASEWTKYILRDIIRVPSTILDEVLRNADEVIAAQGAILNARPVDVHTAMPTGIGAQTNLAKKQFDQEHALATDQQVHQQKMDRAALKQQAQQTEELVKRAQDAVADARARGVQSNGELERGDKELLSEAIARSPELRRTIELGVMLWRDEACVEMHGAVLPDRRSVLAKDSPVLASSISSEDLAEMAEEAADEVEGDGA